MTRTFRFPVIAATAIDGDTVRCVVDLGFHISRRVDVRLDGIDAPEWSGLSKAAGTVARAWVQGWLDSHGELLLASHELDKFGRVLGDILGDAQHGWLVEDLLKAGLAKRTGPSGRREPWTEEELARIVQLPMAPAPGRLLYAPTTKLPEPRDE